MTAPLASQAYERLWHGFRPSTLAAYRRMFLLFLSFLVAVGLSLPQVDTLDILAFIEYLLQAGMTAANITNHLTAIRSCCIIYNIDNTPFRDNRLPLFIKSIKINRSLQPSWKRIVDENILHSICTVCSLPFPKVFKALYLLAYCSCLRLSSIPHSLASFDRTRYLCKGDIILTGKCCGSCVSLPNLCVTFKFGCVPLCPIAALKDMSKFNSTDNDEPVFQICQHSVPVTLIESYAFRHGVPIQDIQAQATWSSSCVWRYINISPGLSSTVSSTFQAHLAV